MKNYPTLDALVRTLRVQLPKPLELWRLTPEPILGTVRGLATRPASPFSGVALATNGILVLIHNPQNGSVAFGHLEWFEPEKPEQLVERKPSKKEKREKRIRTEYV